MAILKHIAVKNADYGEARRYLIFKHDEKTGKPVLDENGNLQFRDNYYLDGINCDAFTFDAECMEVNNHDAEILLFLASPDICDGDLYIEILSGLAFLNLEGIIEVILLQWFAIDFDDVDTLVEAEVVADKIDGCNAIVVGHFSGNLD